jgi:TPR repeat protein
MESMIRHGWGCEQDPTKAITYLSAAASNSAAVEEEALRAGVKRGGAAKGELVLAIFELGNCFRNGWGTDKDPVAARQYYETAANLGDPEAMNEAGWCYLEGFGGKKDKVFDFSFALGFHNIIGVCSHMAEARQDHEMIIILGSDFFDSLTLVSAVITTTGLS